MGLGGVQQHYSHNGNRYDVGLIEREELEKVKNDVREPLKVKVQGICPKCDERIYLEITRTVFACKKCGFIQYTPWEEKPLTLEMINRPEPTNYNRRERKANGRFQEGQNG